MKIKTSTKQWIFFVPLLVLIIFLFNNHIIHSDIYGNLLTGESTYGDLPFHLSQIAQMSYGNIFPPQNPFYANTLLVYPYFINLISVILVWLGISLRNSILFPGVIFSAVTIITLFLFYIKISQKKSASILAVYLFFLNGGLGFYYFFKDVILTNKFIDYLFHPTMFKEYSHLPSQNIQWCSFLTRILVPERSVLLGIPIGLIILIILFFNSKKTIWYKDKYFYLAILLTGLLPLSHTHTFITFAFLIPYLAIFEVSKNNIIQWFLKWFFFGLFVFIIAFPQLKLIFFHLSESTTFIRFHFGWMSKAGLSQFVNFWWNNGGFTLPLIVLSLILCKIPIIIKRLLLFSLFIFIIVNTFLFQPYDWDNIKFLFWFSIFTNIVIAICLVQLWSKKTVVIRCFVIFLLLCLTSTSLISYYREVQIHYQLFSKEEVMLGDWVKKYTDQNSIFLTSFSHNSFVNNLGGRRILMGYQGSLWVHGINYSTREKDINDMYSGNINAKDLIKKYNVTFIIVGPNEINSFKVNENFINQNYFLVKETNNYKIFKANRS